MDPHEKRAAATFCVQHPYRLATTVVPVTGPQYDPEEMSHQMPDLDRTGLPTAWLMRARASDGGQRGSFDRGSATPAHAADDDRQIKKLLNKLGKKADAVEREALTAMRSAPFDRPERERVAVKILTATGMEMTSVRETA